VKPKDLGAGKVTKAAEKAGKKKWMAGLLGNKPITSAKVRSAATASFYGASLINNTVSILSKVLITFNLTFWLICHQCHRKEVFRIAYG
jgi:hypothetical protein